MCQLPLLVLGIAIDGKVQGCQTLKKNSVVENAKPFFVDRVNSLTLVGLRFTQLMRRLIVLVLLIKKYKYIFISFIIILWK